MPWKIGRVCAERIKAKEIESIRHPQDKRTSYIESKEMSPSLDLEGKGIDWLSPG